MKSTEKQNRAAQTEPGRTVLWKRIPEPVQWLSGHGDALFVFFEILTDLFADYLGEDGFISDEDEETDNIIPITEDARRTKFEEI